jgi:Protein of unknown function (DUF3037)
MTSRYSVIQYIPNPISGERINIGVLAFDDEAVRVHFLSKWDRVRCFGITEDIPFLRDFAHRMKKAVEHGLLFPGDKPSDLPKHERLIKVARNWANSIQITEPCGSLENVDALLDDAVQNYLLEPLPKKIKLRDRQAAGQIATSHIKSLLKQRYGDDRAKELLRTDYTLTGSNMDHKFDVTVANGRPFFAAHGISFEIQTPEQTVTSLAYMIIDIKASTPNFPLAIVVLPPKNESPDRKRLEAIYRRTTNTYEQYGAKVLQENQVESWVTERLQNVGL